MLSEYECDTLIAWELDYKFMDLQIDFEIVICWLTLNGNMAPTLALLICDCKVLLSRAWTVLPRHIFHEANSVTSGLVKKGVMQRSSLVEYA